jgi:hypothetical protein
MTETRHAPVDVHQHHHLRDIIDNAEREDANEALKEERADNGFSAAASTSSASASSTTATEDPDAEITIVSWTTDDPENPHNWSNLKKKWIVFLTIVVITNSTMGSALPSNAVPYIIAEWGVTSSTQKVLPMSVYLIGE